MSMRVSGETPWDRIDATFRAFLEESGYDAAEFNSHPNRGDLYNSFRKARYQHRSAQKRVVTNDSASSLTTTLGKQSSTSMRLSKVYEKKNTAFRLSYAGDVTPVLPTKSRTSKTKRMTNPPSGSFPSNKAIAQEARQRRPSRISSMMNPSEMRWERIEAFFFNHGMEVALGIWYLALNLLVASHGAYQFSEAGGYTTDSDVLRWTLPIARAGGRLVTLNAAVLLLTACKYLWTLVRTYVVPVVPLGFPIDNVMPKYHRVVALLIIFEGCIVHTIPQVVNYATGEIPLDCDQKFRVWTFGNGFATTQLLLTGILLFVVFGTFFLTTLKSFRKSAAGFRWFWMFHVGGIVLAYPLLIIHGSLRGHPIFLCVALIPMILYVFDYMMRRWSIFPTNIRRWKLHEDEGQQIVELVIDCPEGFEYTPGQYAELNFARISRTEWHPFTIASAPNEEKSNSEVVFYVKNAGRWTGALTNYASTYDLSKAASPPKISIRGPHGAPAANYSEYQHIVVIGSGVGVTPLLSIWNLLVQKGKRLSAEQKINAQRSSVLSMHHLQKTMDVLMDPTSSTDASKSMIFRDGSIPIGQSNDSENSTQPSTETTRKIRSLRIFVSKYLESMTLSLSLFTLFVLGETFTIMLHLSGYSFVADTIGATLSLLALTAHGTIAIFSAIATGPSIYFRTVRFCLEGIIIIASITALYHSIKGCILARKNEDDTREAAAYFANFGPVIVFQTLRIFHLFYVTLKAPACPDNDEDCENHRADNDNDFYSVKGIVINRKYSNMRFAAKALLPPILEHGLSSVFSMEFYGTRETRKKEKTNEQSTVGRMMVDSVFCAGRPDWNRVFTEAISRAHVTKCKSVGVFFCGSPAIARDLQAEARRVTAQHQFATKKLSGEASPCKIIVHSENF